MQNGDWAMPAGPVFMHAGMHKYALLYTTDIFDQRGTVDSKTFLKHLTQYTIDFCMKKHDIFDDKTL